MQAESPLDGDGAWLRCALHAHTTNSDGELRRSTSRSTTRAPATTSSASPTTGCGRRYPMRTGILVIPGAELNATIDGTGSDAHVLGLGIEADPVEPGRDFPNLRATVDWILERAACRSSPIPTGAGCGRRSSPAARGCSASRSTTPAASSRSGAGSPPCSGTRRSRRGSGCSRSRRTTRTFPATTAVRLGLGPRRRALARRACSTRFGAAGSTAHRAAARARPGRRARRRGALHAGRLGDTRLGSTAGARANAGRMGYRNEVEAEEVEEDADGLVVARAAAPPLVGHVVRAGRGGGRARAPRLDEPALVRRGRSYSSASARSKLSSKQGAPSNAASPAGRLRGAARARGSGCGGGEPRPPRRMRRRARRAGTSGPGRACRRPPSLRAPPEPPPATTVRSRELRRVSAHASIVGMRIATLGDVMLDVIVRLEEPLARGDDVRAATRAGAGGQAANVAAWAASLGAEARCIAKRGDDAAGELVGARARGARRRARRPGRRGRDRRRRLGRRGRRALAGLGPRRRAEPRGRTSSIPPGSPATSSTSPATRSCASRSAARRSRRPAGAGGGRAGLGRRRGLDGDPPLRAGALPRAARRAGARRPLRDRGGVGAAGRRIPRRADRRAQARRARLYGA